MRIWACLKCGKRGLHEADLDPLTEAQQDVPCRECGAVHHYYDCQWELATPVWIRWMGSILFYAILALIVGFLSVVLRK